MEVLVRLFDLCFLIRDMCLRVLFQIAGSLSITKGVDDLIDASAGILVDLSDFLPSSR